MRGEGSRVILPALLLTLHKYSSWRVTRVAPLICSAVRTTLCSLLWSDLVAELNQTVIDVQMTDLMMADVTYISAGIQLYKSPEGGQLKNQQPSKSPSSASAQKRAFSSCCGTKGMCGNASQRHSFIS